MPKKCAGGRGSSACSSCSVERYIGPRANFRTIRGEGDKAELLSVRWMQVIRTKEEIPKKHRPRSFPWSKGK